MRTPSEILNDALRWLAGALFRLLVITSFGIGLGIVLGHPVWIAIGMVGAGVALSAYPVTTSDSR